MTFGAIQRQTQRDQLRVAGVTEGAVDASLKKTTRQPKGVEISYAGFLVSRQRSINAEIAAQLDAMRSILDMARVDATERVDDLNDDIVTAFESLKALAARLTSATQGVLRLGVAEHGAKTAAFNDAKYASPVMRVLGIGNASSTVERSILRGWATENVQLTQNMNAEQLDKLETSFIRALRDGSRSSQVQADVEIILGQSTNRARLIARDQIGKLNGQLDRQKQTEAGIDTYVWRGSLDSRERPAHVAREGNVYKWSDPPPDGHPGQPVQCRCTAEPDLTDLLGEEFKPEDTRLSVAATAQLAEERAANTRRQAVKRRKRRKRIEPKPTQPVSRELTPR